jgi:hypothetical protein
MQSSQNRLALDRDALNSAVAKWAWTLGVFFYWGTKSKRELFAKLANEGLKGLWWLWIFKVYNGQTANRVEA